MKHTQAGAAVRNWITTRALRPGMQLPSARLLAEQLGFRRKTMDRACQDLISQGLLIRRNYKLFVGTGKTSPPPIQGEICVVSYWPQFITAAGRILAGHGVRYRGIEFTSKKNTDPLPALRRILAQNPAGIILRIPFWFDSLNSVIESTKIPMVVCTNRIPPEINQHVIGVDWYRGMEIAVRHLRDLGHRHIAYLSVGDSMPVTRELSECFRVACLELDLKQSAQAVWQGDATLDDEICDFMIAQRKNHPEVTAIIGRSVAVCLAAKIFRVPEELSVVGASGQGGGGRPALTIFELFNSDEMFATLACPNLISQIQTLESGKPALMPYRILFVPKLVVRESTRALSRKEQGQSARDGTDGRRVKPHPSISAKNQPRRPASPWESWRKTYHYLHKTGSRNWRQLDLSGPANHSMTRKHGWLGEEPLLHFSPGLRSVHGVPFQVIDENRNDGRAVVTFRSPHTHTGGGRELPVSMNLPLDGCVQALYFLHGCGWAKPVQFAEYIMHFKNGLLSTVPLVGEGSSPQAARKHPGSLKPNIQDWWPEFERHDFPHAMHATIFNPAEPREYERHLFTLEWINPHPKDAVSHIEVRADPKAGPALALIAVTALM